jgi:hypothetical protein
LWSVVTDPAMRGAPRFADALHWSGAVDRLAEHMKVLRIANNKAAAARGVVQWRGGPRVTLVSRGGEASGRDRVVHLAHLWLRRRVRLCRLPLW